MMKLKLKKIYINNSGKYKNSCYRIKNYILFVVGPLTTGITGLEKKFLLLRTDRSNIWL